MLKQWLIVLGLLAAAGDPRVPYHSVQLLTVPDGVCTAFSINEQQGYWVTDDHCLEDGLGTIKRFPTTLVKAWPDLDLAVLAGPPAPGLKIAEEIPVARTPIFKWGYGQSARPWMSKGYTTQHFAYIPMAKHIVWLYNLEIAPGDSGAPVMTYDGVVVSVAEIYWPPSLKKKSRLLSSYEHPGGGLDTITLHEALAPYLPGYVAPKGDSGDRQASE